MAARVQIVESFGSAHHAGPKAQRDVSAILRNAGWSDFRVRRIASNSWLLKNLGRAFWLVMARCYRLRLPREGVVFLQYPGVSFANNATFCLFNERDKRKRGYKLVVLVHDLKDFRDGKRQLCQNEKRLMEMADAVILHNAVMVEAVAACGVSCEKLVALECFDYLANGPEAIVRKNAAVINVAGNLSVARSGWMRGVGALKGLHWKMFGTSFDPRTYGEGDFVYGGSVSPEALPSELSDGYGLVWYSDSSESISGKIVDYIRIINPHKLSLYLRAGLPVIVWREAAVASFVESRGVGLVVDSLSEIPARVAAVDDRMYDAMAAAARRVGAELARGEFTRRAVEAAVVLTQRHTEILGIV